MLAVLVTIWTVCFLILLLVPQKKEPAYVTGIDWGLGGDSSAVVIRREDGTLETIDASVIRQLRPGGQP